MAKVLILGDGVAARAAAHLLRVAQTTVGAKANGRPRVPAVLIGEATQHLFQDVLGMRNAFAGRPVVTRRIVDWGGHGPPRELPHAAVVVSEGELLAGLPELPAEATGERLLCCERPLPEAVEELTFGERRAMASVATLNERAQGGTCYVESVASGWLFLLPSGHLLRVGEDAEAVLGASRLIAPLLAEPGDISGSFACSPRLSWPMGGTLDGGWLAAGSAAMGFDPLCGDGTGNALREAILAAAILSEDRVVEGMLEHYQTRLLLGFARHLAVCREFYRSGGESPWWREQLAVTERGMQWCDAEIARRPPPRYRLEGTRLVGL